MKKIIYYTDDVFTYIEQNTKDIINFLESQGEEINEDRIYAQALADIESESEYFMEDIKSIEVNNIFAVASFGLWNGKQEGYKIFKDLYSALSQLLQDYNTIYSDRKNTTLKLEAIHHDGRNKISFYEVKENKKSDYILSNYYYLSDRELFKKLKDANCIKAIKLYELF